MNRSVTSIKILWKTHLAGCGCTDSWISNQPAGWQVSIRILQFCVPICPSSFIFPLKFKILAVRLIIFLVLNFGALAVGAQFTREGVPSEWYQTLNKAPWTPPGWVFVAAWTTIMICSSFYMAKAYEVIKNKKELLGLYVFQLVLNIMWNPIFFKFHAVNAGLVTITSLTVLLFIFIFHYKSLTKNWTALLLPYVIWLVIATSLNAYVCLMN